MGLKLLLVLINKYILLISIENKGENGYFRISMGNNMCGIGAQAFYLCPDYICLTNKATIPNSKLPGNYIIFFFFF